MKRIRFVKDVTGHPKNSFASLPDAMADEAIKKGHAEEVEPPKSVGNEHDKPQNMTRLRFISGTKDGFRAGEIQTMPEAKAAKYLKAKQAEEFPIGSTAALDEKAKSEADIDEKAKAKPEADEKEKGRADRKLDAVTAGR